MSEIFFDEITEASYVKSEIVSKYFLAWAKIMKNNAYNDKLGYIDLFSGPGRYADGTPSTPLKVIEHILSDEVMREKFVTIFNDKDPKNTKQLQDEINNIPGIKTLKNAPHVSNIEVNDKMIAQFKETKLIPNLAFVDPFGYKGLSLTLIKSLMKDWGSDCIFFFNYNRISIGITNWKIEHHIDAMFGKELADKLRGEIDIYKKEEKVAFIINALAQALHNNGSNFVLPFQFNKGNKISHYLIFVTKHQLGYKIMKEIMWRASSEHNDGVANFAYIPVQNEQLEILFDYTKPLDMLGKELLHIFRGRTLTLSKVFELHNVRTPFVLQNYKEALRRLEASGEISANPPAKKRRLYKGELTFPDHVSISFP